MVRFKRSHNSLIVSITGEIDAESVKSMRMKIDVEYEESGAKDIIFDMERVNFMDSTGVGMIIGRCKKIAPLGGRVKLFGCSGVVKRIVELSGLGKIVKIYENENSALGKGAE